MKRNRFHGIYFNKKTRIQINESIQSNEFSRTNKEYPTILPQAKPYEDAINHAPKEKKSFIDEKKN
jgi:hypothetical protein